MYSIDLSNIEGGKPLTPQKSSVAVQEHDDAERQNQPGKDVSGILIIPRVAPQINPREARKRLISGLLRGCGVALAIIGGWFGISILCEALDATGVVLAVLGLWIMICLMDSADCRNRRKK